jgi:asparagine synthase (glutamine-hydrolysing)
MCGIGGIVVPAGTRVVPERLRRMASSMMTRGPDAEGMLVGSSIGLVHRRLSILDLSELGNCPMPNEDGSIHALLNGEIYNWRELRAELVDRGHRFRSMADSEVLSHGYEQWGETLISRLRGMFALAIWDEVRARLILARDRVGEKPLFLRQDKGRTLFASTLAAILAYDDEMPSIDADALACCLAHSFIPSTHTVWQGVTVFPPAHYAVVDTTGAISLHRYWQFPLGRRCASTTPAAEREVERILQDSVSRCLDADVPVGAFLSGGVDSSLVAALAVRRAPGMASFSIGFEEAGWSELPYSRKVAKHLDMDHHELVVRANDVLRVLARLVWHFGQPFGDASAVPTYLLSRFAREHVKVCVSGDGGDEAFAGYWRVQAGLYAARYAALVPRAARKSLVPHIARMLGPLGRRVAAMNKLSLAPAGSGYTNSQSWHDMLSQVAGAALRPGLDHDRVACRVGRRLEADGGSVIQRLLYDDFQVQLPDDYLTKVDVASMAASLEVRAPMLDFSVLETAWRLPDRMKLHWGQRKWMLKRIAARLVPPDAIHRPKMGFAMPLSHWFRKELGVVLERLLADSVSAREGWIDAERALRELHAHRAGARDSHTRLWLILWLELWFRIVVAREMPPDHDLAEQVR